MENTEASQKVQQELLEKIKAAKEAKNPKKVKPAKGECGVKV